MELSSLTICELAKRCLEDRDESVWTEFIRRLQPLVAAVVIKTSRRCGVGEAHATDDLVQDVFLRLCRDSRRILQVCETAEEEGSCFAYIKVITANVVFDHYKYRSADKRSFLIEESLDQEADAAIKAPSPQLLNLDIDRLLREEKVPERDQSIFWMYFRQGFSAKEIAQSSRINLSVKGVESCIYRLTSLLRERFTQGIAAKGGGG